MNDGINIWGSETCQGKEVDRIFWPDGSTIVFDEEEQGFFSYEYHGDHAENWVIVTSVGREIQRHNAAHLSSIIWKKPNPSLQPTPNSGVDFS